jgi:hypothetical protein
MFHPIRLIAVAGVALAACGGSPPPSSEGNVINTGAERFAWDQPARDAGEVASFRYALYVDGVRSEAQEVSCVAGQASGQFTCTSRMPPMSSGAHTVQVAAFVVEDGAVLESPRSTDVRVLKR